MDPKLLAAGLGAVTGGVGGYFTNEANKDALKNQLAYLNSLPEKLKAQNKERIDLIQSKLDEVEKSAGGEVAVQNYYDLLKGYNPDQYVYDPATQEQFKYGKTEADFVDPGAKYRQDAARKATESSLAGQGNLYSGGAGRQLDAEAQDLASQEYAKSNERMVADKTTAYQQYRDKVADIKAKLAGQGAGYMQKINYAEIPKNDIYAARTTASGQKLTALEQSQQNDLDLQNTIAGVQQQRDKISGWQGTAGSILNGATGGATAGSNIYSALKGNTLNETSVEKQKI